MSESSRAVNQFFDFGTSGQCDKQLDNATNKLTELKGPVKAKSGRLTDDTLEVITGQHEQLIRKIPVGYGIAKEHAERQVKKLNPVFDVTAAADSGAQRKVV